MPTEYNVLAWSQSSGTNTTHVDTVTADSPEEAVQKATDRAVEIRSLDDDEVVDGETTGYHAIPVEAYHTFVESG